MTEPTPAPAPLSLISRFFGVITAPKATFENVVANPRPVGILLISAFLISAASVVPQFTEAGRRAGLDMQVKSMERFGVTVTPEVYEKMEASSRSTTTKVIAFMGSFVGMPIVSLLFAALYWAIFNTALGGTAAFKQVLAIITHSQVIGALGYLAAVPVQLMQGTVSMTGPFTLRALAPMLEEGSLLASILSWISVFGLWGLIVTGIGLGVLYRRSGRNISIALIAVFVLLVVVANVAVSSFTNR